MQRKRDNERFWGDGIEKDYESEGWSRRQEEREKNGEIKTKMDMDRDSKRIDTRS